MIKRGVKNRITRIFSVAGFLMLTGLSAYCQTTKGNAQPGKSKNPNGRNDSWGFIGSGGGGAMFYPTFSPHDPKFAFVACDMTGSYVTYDGGGSWAMVNSRCPG